VRVVGGGVAAEDALGDMSMFVPCVPPGDLQGPHIICALLDACAVMLCAVQQQLEQHHVSLTVLQVRLLMCWS
jgi:hypothetical protein